MGAFLYGQIKVPNSANAISDLAATGNSADCPATVDPNTNTITVSGICVYSVINQNAANPTQVYMEGFRPTQYNLTTIPGAVSGSPRAVPAIATTVSDLGLY